MSDELPMRLHRERSTTNTSNKETVSEAPEQVIV
jgi:hypothetical protein